MKRAFGQHYERADKGLAISDDARRWEGWGTALKPAHEPIALARKPFRGTVAGNVLVHGTGAINIDACRVGSDGGCAGAGAGAGAAIVCFGGGLNGTFAKPVDGLGRWPANVMTDGSIDVLESFPPSARDAIRFFYAPKADRAEREFGLRDGGVGALRDGKRSTQRVANHHPTVKPVDLMAWLCRLTTATGGVVLDPFAGSGSTGIAAIRHGFRFVGIEQSPEYFEIAVKRITAAAECEDRMPTIERHITRAVRAVQLSMFATAE
ncbi:MAG: site-specific DNA-methyltransferase [Hyphomicrobium sp.]|nr:site-specific DNA-methyltransferase [Hyphomicrobium sp.]